MQFIVGVFCFLFCVLVWFLQNSVRTIQEGHIAIVERFGKFDRIAHPGLHLLQPFENFKRVCWTRKSDTLGKKESFVSHSIPNSSVAYDFPSQKVVTKDKVITSIDGILYYNIIDPLKSVYKTKDLWGLIDSKIPHVILEACSGVPSEHINSSPASICDSIRKKLNTTLLEAYGVEVESVTLEPTKFNTGMELSSSQHENARLKLESERSLEEKKLVNEQHLADKRQELRLHQLDIDEKLRAAEREKEHEAALSHLKHERVLWEMKNALEEEKAQAEIKREYDKKMSLAKLEAEGNTLYLNSFGIIPGNQVLGYLSSKFQYQALATAKGTYIVPSEALGGLKLRFKTNSSSPPSVSSSIDG